MNGWMGNKLEVNLTKEEIKVEKTEKELRQNFLGGRGFGSALLYKRLDPQVDPLSKDNLIVIATGPLTGAGVPTPGRFSASTKSPLTGTISDSNCGGNWGPTFKSNGYDYLALSGRAKEPLYLLVSEEGLELKSAAELWGEKTGRTEEILKERHGSGAEVLCIGPGGENAVRFASVMTGSSALGRAGLGAVFGSKKLKAVVTTRGEEKISYADGDRLKLVNQEAVRNVRQSPITSKAYPQFGTAVLMNVINEAGILPKNNYLHSDVEEEVEGVSGEAIRENVLEGRSGCWGCMIRCKPETSTGEESGGGPEYETDWALGPNCGNYDLKKITEANYRCNEYGIDTISAGGTIACAMEMAEEGLLDWDIGFGEEEKIPGLVEKIALREGIGDQLAEGSKRLAEAQGEGARAMHSKGLELPAYDPRGAQGQGLAYATSNRGACHLRGGYLIGPEVLGAPELIDRFAHTGKANLVVESQDMGAVFDSLTICRFSNFAVSKDVLGRLLSAATGGDYDSEELLEIGERISNVERLFNIKAGFSREDDTLPQRLLESPLPSGPAEGEVVELEPMLEEYYDTRGWDENGEPRAKTLDRLELSEFV